MATTTPSSLRDTELFQELLRRGETNPAVADLAIKVESVFGDACSLTGTIMVRMTEYTLHDAIHLLRVVMIMGNLLPSNVLTGLSPLEIASLILAGALHDIGMAPDAREIEALLSDSPNPAYPIARQAYRAFRERYASSVHRQMELRRDGRDYEANEIEGFIISEYIRQTHAERGRQMIHKLFSDRLTYDGFNFSADLAKVCYSHNDSPQSLLFLADRDLVRAGAEYCNWRFVAIVLRLADILDFDPKRTPTVLFEHLGIHTDVSVSEWRKHQAIKGWDIRPDYIAFAAQCESPVIEKTIKSFIADINRELTEAGALLHTMLTTWPDERARYDVPWPMSVDDSNIGPAYNASGPLYKYLDISFQLDRESIMSLLMGMRLYADQSLFLRELLQNAVDACRHRSEFHKHNPAHGKYNPEIKVTYEKVGDKQTLVIEDNGIGMDENIVTRYFAHVGRSYYRSPEFLQDRSTNTPTFQPISQFGIGVLSAFMVSDHLDVESLRFGSVSPVSVTIPSIGSLFWFRTGSRSHPGTRITLHLTEPLENWTTMPPPIYRATRNSKNGELYKFKNPKERLAYTVEILAPHLEIPITIHNGKRISKARNEWNVFHGRPWEDGEWPEFMQRFELNLTRDAPEGLNGIAQVLLIVKNDSLTKEAIIETISRKVGKSKFVLEDSFLYKKGSIYLMYDDISLRENTRAKSTILMATSGGRWSQRGFRVRYDLFARDVWHDVSATVDGPQAKFPFPVAYDIDLNGEWCLPLSADRKHVLPTQEAQRTCNSIADVMMKLLVDKIETERGVDDRNALFSFIDDPVYMARHSGIASLIYIEYASCTPSRTSKS